jgi:hypothetical protein
VVSFTPRPLYLQGKSPWYPLDRIKEEDKLKICENRERDVRGKV